MLSFTVSKKVIHGVEFAWVQCSWCMLPVQTLYVFNAAIHTYNHRLITAFIHFQDTFKRLCASQMLDHLDSPHVVTVATQPPQGLPSLLQLQAVMQTRYTDAATGFTRVYPYSSWSTACEADLDLRFKKVNLLTIAEMAADKNCLVRMYVVDTAFLLLYTY